MFWLPHLITSISLVNTYNGRKHKMLDRNQKFEDIIHLFLVLVLFIDIEIFIDSH